MPKPQRPFLCQEGQLRCPNSAPQCKCGEHALGLLGYTVNDEHHNALSAVLDQYREPQALTLSVLTFDPEPASNVVEIAPVVQCDGSYTCPCSDCRQEVADRMRRLQNRRAA